MGFCKYLSPIEGNGGKMENKTNCFDYEKDKKNSKECKNTSLFASINEVPSQYPWLSFDEECEVLVIGGGITGAFCLYYLAQAGIEAVMVSQKPIGFSSASINSSALQYQNELMLTHLSKSAGKDKAIGYFKMCEQALNEIEGLADEIDDFKFTRRDSLLYTSSPEQVDKLHTEYLMRRHNGFDVQFLEKHEARELFSFDVMAGILSSGASGEVDGYKLCHALVSSAEKKNSRIYENTSITAIENAEVGVIAETSYGRKIKAKKVIMAIGKAQEQFLDKEVNIKTSFTIATEPVKGFAGYDSRAIVKNIDNNIYMRTTHDNRIIIGGLDCSLLDRNGKLAKVIGIEKLVERKYSELESALNKMLVGIDDIRVEYRYSGEYGQTNDMLPLSAEYEEYRDIIFLMPPSINGILYSQIVSKTAAESIKAKY